MKPYTPAEARMAIRLARLADQLETAKRMAKLAKAHSAIHEKRRWVVCFYNSDPTCCYLIGPGDLGVDQDEQLPGALARLLASRLLLEPAEEVFDRHFYPGEVIMDELLQMIRDGDITRETAIEATTMEDLYVELMTLDEYLDRLVPDKI